MTQTASPAAAVAIDPQRWADLTRVPTGLRARVSAGIARRLFDAIVRRFELTVSSDPADGADLVLHRPDEFFARLGSDGLIGFGEAYQNGTWDAPDLGGLLTTLCAEISTLVPQPLQRLRAAYVARPPRHQRNTRANTRDNVARHYDLSNDLFATFLDPSLSYSAALFDTPALDGDLHEAQHRKIDRLLDQARVGPGTRVLEIGTGWGELAIRAAARGATVRTVTLSSEQLELATERIAAAGYADRVQVDLLDYRAVSTGSTSGEQYDAVLSVEMVEAVGHEYWSTYFRKVDSLLAPGGIAAIQAITMPHDRMLATRRTWTWINKYIFPGGFLPSVEAIEQVTRDDTTLRVVDRLSFGRHYAETLRRWDEAFRAASGRVLELGFDETFLRTWHFYLEYSRAGFASDYIDVQQITLSREESR